MPTSNSISKGELLSLLIEKGHTSPLNDAFQVDTEAILFDKFGLDVNCDDTAKAVKEQARIFRCAVKPHYAKYGKLDPIFNNNPVRKFSSFSFCTCTLEKVIKVKLTYNL